MKNLITTILAAVFAYGCTTGKSAEPGTGNSEVHITGAMKEVMWEGRLQGKILLDTIFPRTGLYGLGPAEDLPGEILIFDGKSYIARVTGDAGIQVKETWDLKAPFFVHANATDWEITDLPQHITNLKDLETYLDSTAGKIAKPFVFKLSGIVASADYHVQDLPKGTKVSSPQEAHTGQKDYKLKNTGVDIAGFYSTGHKGIFTHHDSNVHMHLITTDRSKMGIWMLPFLNKAE